MPLKKTPGVYIEEKNAFPNSVVEVRTAVPVFVGYTKTALRGSQYVKKIPVRLTSLAEFHTIYGDEPTPTYKFKFENDKITLESEANSQFNLYNGMRLFFNNGGGPCWIVSVGDYAIGTKAADHFGESVWNALEKEPEPTMVVIPDAVLMPSAAAYKGVWDLAFKHCTDMKNRIAIIDVFNGYLPRDNSPEDIISGTEGLRNLFTYDNLNFGAAYYPWVNTNIYGSTNASYLNIHKDTRKDLSDYVHSEFLSTSTIYSVVGDLLNVMTGDDESLALVVKTHQALFAVSTRYKEAIRDVLSALNLMPPAAAMAGVFTRTDNNIGVWKAPANTGIVSVMSPCLTISDEEQEDLNVPLDGKAINAIRSFVGRGVLVWGARTLDGNSQDWRYINVRRTLIMLEQSISNAAEAYVFAPNDAATWITVQSMVENFLNNQWKAGALAGATPDEAYKVNVGLGSTMTGNDILDGYMHVSVQVAVTRPAEFIVITFQQKMQTS